jgi:fimbrial isopeptide formation D2 family protein/LPXTG-motif cell wall-anchored protein
VDTAGNVKLDRTTGDLTQLTGDEITAIKGYVDESMLVATVNTTAADTDFTVAQLPYGYYYITTTTGTVVTVNSTKPNANVADKNEVPPVTKVISATDKGSYDTDGKKALAEVGSTVTYTATITKKKGAENYVFHDKMDDTLSYNGDVKVYSDATCTTEVASTNYDTTTATNDTLTVTFDNTYIAGLADNTVLYIRYTAKITSAALQDNPAKNTASLSYGHTPGSNSTPVVQTETYNAEISVLKKDGKNTDGKTDDTPLSGAGFKLYKFDTDGTTKLYYHLDTSATPNVVVWGTKDQGDQHTSGNDGKVPAFTGLQDGTYYLEETTVPSGFNKADDTSVTIAAHDYTPDNLKQEKEIINNKGGILPSTGGMGTTIFYIIGAILVAGAVIVLVTKRRMNAE